MAKPLKRRKLPWPREEAPAVAERRAASPEPVDHVVWEFSVKDGFKAFDDACALAFHHATKAICKAKSRWKPCTRAI